MSRGECHDRAKLLLGFWVLPKLTKVRIQFSPFLSSIEGYDLLKSINHHLLI